MTSVQFYHNAANPLALACELVARAYASGRRIAVRTADAASAKHLDDALWTFEPGGFIPHVQLGTPLSPETPVVVAHAQAASDWPHHDLLFNLATDAPTDFCEFRTVVEIVGQGDDDRFAARARWMHYKSQGAEMKAFDAVLRERI
ncbi:MAG TPA: DNA polymerase III subunit chi [Azoarcus taiwanensis]|nr:DNA polymerase III subunit chi [Azoarcus taiwanensis]